MNRTGTKAKARLLSVKRVIRRRRLAATLAIAVSMLASATVLATPASAAAGDLAGSWTSIDLDGSNQTLKLKGAGNPVYSAFLRDDFTSGVCGGPPAKLVGHAAADGNGLLMRGTLVCLHRGNPVPGVRVVFSFEYDPANDTLTDDSGVVWERAS
jgi:hypothetical protein